MTAVDVDILHRDDGPEGLNPRLVVATPRVGGAGTLPAELLVIDPRTLDLGVMS